MKITIETIPHKEQRYDTCGDWYFLPGGDLVIRVSDLGDWRENFLVGIHELIEGALCKHAGISQESVDRFDVGAGADLEEPGESADAPYHRQHMIAYGIEMVLEQLLDVDFNAYAKHIENLG